MTSANQAATNQAAKPSGKMSFIPASPAPRDAAPKSPRAVANPVVRRELSQPPKYAVAAGAAPDATRSQNGGIRSVASRPAKPQPSVVASKTPMQAPIPQPIQRPQQPVEKFELPTETVEPVVVATKTVPMRTLEEPEFEEPIPEKAPGRGVVQLFIDDELADEESDQMMDVDESPDPAPIAQRDEIRRVAAQNDSDKVQNANDLEEVRKTKERELAKRKLMARVLADLTPVRKINLADAINLPPPSTNEKGTENVDPEPNEMTALAMRLTDLGKDDSKNVLQPTDTALAMLSQRKPFKVFAVSRDPWQANRDSYPFHHKPLWFEDPNLERCGRGCGLFTTTVSAIRASANIPILPYRFTAEKPWSCVRTLPDCSVCEKFGVEAYLPPWSLSAAVVQAAAAVGVVYIVP
jgi:hypothetical protein